MDPKQTIIRELVEEAMSSDRSVEDVCDGYPNLVDDVRVLWRRACLVADQIETLFPDSDLLNSCLDNRSAGDGVPCDGAMPRIPGYDVQSVVGFGGMGVVYKARHLSLDRIVAVKVPLAGAFASTSDRKRHFREAQAIATLDHPNIITIHEVGEVAGRPYLTMEFIDGQYLGARIAGTPQPVRDSAALIATLADAIHHGHVAGVTHRDLKPANILLTSDGTPKITDFGLARRATSDATITAGLNFGTPSYMPPEQAGGQMEARHASVDIYSLGAILYEMLTGRPPFRAGTAIETMRLVIEEDVVPPSRLNRKVSRDVETICLTCLRKAPAQRYASAAALADDLRRYLDGRPIHARPTGLVERTVKWVRRKPALATAIACLALLTGLVAGGAIWQASESSARARAAEEDLREAIRLHGEMSWDEATAAIERAAFRLGDGGPAELRHRLLVARSDSKLAASLDAASLHRLDSASPFHDHAAADAMYLDLFRSSDVIPSTDEPSEVVASRIAASHIRGALLDAIDVWAATTPDAHRRQVLRDIAERVDPSPLRRQLNHEPVPDQQALDRLVGRIDASLHRPMMLIAFSWRFDDTAISSMPLLLKVQRAHPTNFWANFSLGNVLAQFRSSEAIRYYQAAMVLRPDASVIQNNFGIALSHAGQFEEAKAAFEISLQHHPDSPIIQANLAGALLDLGRCDEAIALSREVLRKHPQEPEAHAVLAEALFTLGRADESLAVLREAMEVPALAEGARQFLLDFLGKLGRLGEVRDLRAQDIRANPGKHERWDGYAELCLFLGDEVAYRDAARELLQRFGDDPDPGVSERTGRACLLLPTTPEQLARARAAIDRAIAVSVLTGTSSPGSPDHSSYYRVAGALAAYRLGEYERALALLDYSAREVLGPVPLLIMAMAHHKLGQEASAQEVWTRVLAHPQWNEPPNSRERWMSHILRREAQALLDTREPSPADEPSTPPQSGGVK